MVVVPYPRVNSIVAETQPYRLDVSARAFGSDVTAGLENLSRAVGKFGDVQAEHAIKFQEQENDLKVTEAENKNLMDEGIISGQFRTTTGDNANPEALKGYFETLEET